jgi:hypothetical protein
VDYLSVLHEEKRLTGSDRAGEQTQQGLIQPLDQGVISNSKVYYLIHTFKQLTEETGGEDKQSSRQLWKDYNIMNKKVKVPHNRPEGPDGG